jgi:hypothetical protein
MTAGQVVDVFRNRNASKLALSLWEREMVRANFTLTPNPSPKGEGENGAAGTMLHGPAL